QISEYLLKDNISLMADDLSANDAAMFAMLPYHVDALDAALLAEQYERPVDEIATLYFEAYHVLQLDWMMDNIATLPQQDHWDRRDRKSTRLNSSHVKNSYAVFCLKKNSNHKRYLIFHHKYNKNIN